MYFFLISYLLQWHYWGICQWNIGMIYIVSLCWMFIFHLTQSHHNDSFFLHWAVHYPSRIKEQVFFKLSFYPQRTWSCAHFGQHLRQQQHNWVDLSCKLLLRECKNASDSSVPARTSVMWLHQVGPGWKGVPTKVAISLPSSFGHQVENVMKGSWIEIRTLQRSLSSYCHRQNRLHLGKWA